ncbi:hypothetical protein llap_21165 [Limosa lapponica baueri]|uniref:Uncharacterized protein n=1 Tax=Limosa lapponica baueri TaxID=1758121 RepID=A0A2I0T409_LIMLA|nr:hypothetical protein llap_21165 [Limosa lapponica baueri]
MPASPFHQLCCPPLDAFKDLHILLNLWAPELHAGLKLKRAVAPTESLTTTEQSNAITTVSSTKAAAATTPVLSPIPAAALMQAPVSTTPTPAAVACAPAPVSVPKEEKPPETPTAISPSSAGKYE